MTPEEYAKHDITFQYSEHCRMGKRIEELKQALADAIEWNWLDDDAPTELKIKYIALIQEKENA